MTIEETVRKADASWNSGVIGQCFANILKDNPNLTMADMEKILRASDSKTYLIAKPKEFAPRGLSVLSAAGKPATHWLWVCLHGYEEALRELELIDRTEEENLAALTTTGFLVAEMH